MFQILDHYSGCWAGHRCFWCWVTSSPVKSLPYEQAGCDNLGPPYLMSQALPSGWRKETLILLTAPPRNYVFNLELRGETYCRVSFWWNAVSQPEMKSTKLSRNGGAENPSSCPGMEVLAGHDLNAVGSLLLQCVIRLSWIDVSVFPGDPWDNF